MFSFKHPKIHYSFLVHGRQAIKKYGIAVDGVVFMWLKCSRKRRKKIAKFGYWDHVLFFHIGKFVNGKNALTIKIHIYIKTFLFNCLWYMWISNESDVNPVGCKLIYAKNIHKYTQIYTNVSVKRREQRNISWIK